MCFQEKNMMYVFWKFELWIKNAFDQYLNCPHLNVKNLKGLINQGFSKIRWLIEREYNNYAINNNNFT